MEEAIPRHGQKDRCERHFGRIEAAHAKGILSADSRRILARIIPESGRRIHIFHDVGEDAKRDEPYGKRDR